MAVLGVRSTSPPEDGLHPLREVSVANTDLLFSLFRGIEEEQPKVTVVRRGRWVLFSAQMECLFSAWWQTYIKSFL
jgi:hypothetical protein